MNVNWKEAILQAQKKIDQVLDIRPDTVEVEIDEHQEEIVEQNCSSPSQGSESLAEDIVMLEPVLPPFHNNRYVGDDIQTIISSDIEHLTRVSSRTVSPERLKIQMEFDTEVSFSQPSPASLTPAAAHPVQQPAEATLPNPEDILNQAISGLRKELNEYKKVNQILQNSQATLEREIEENRFSDNEKLVNMLGEEREHFNQEISQLKLVCAQAIKEKLDLEEKQRDTIETWSRIRKLLILFKDQMHEMKNTLRKTEETFVTDFETFAAEVRRILENQEQLRRKQSTTPKVIRLPCNCEKRSENEQSRIVKHDDSTQTDAINPYETYRNKKEEKENSPHFATGKTGNVTDLLQIIEQLEAEKKHLLMEKKSDKREIERLQEQLNETLIMHGEKIEQLDEVLVDNEELKKILKQQALELTNHRV